MVGTLSSRRRFNVGTISTQPYDVSALHPTIAQQLIIAVALSFERHGLHAVAQGCTANFGLNRYLTPKRCGAFRLTSTWRPSHHPRAK